MRTPPPSLASQCATAALALLGLVGGWLIVLTGGFHHAPNRYRPDTIFVDGAPALMMAAIFFAMAAIGMAALLRARQCRARWYALACGAVLVPPLLYVL